MTNDVKLNADGNLFGRILALGAIVGAFLWIGRIAGVGLPCCATADAVGLKHCATEK